MVMNHIDPLQTIDLCKTLLDRLNDAHYETEHVYRQVYELYESFPCQRTEHLMEQMDRQRAVSHQFLDRFCEETVQLIKEMELYMATIDVFPPDDLLSE